MNESKVAENVAQHTPGPWTVKEHNSGASMIHAGPFDILLTSRTGARADVWTANARLIAAAPDLLEVVKACRDAVYRDPKSPSNLASMCDLAIAKADGR